MLHHYVFHEHNPSLCKNPPKWQCPCIQIKKFSMIYGGLYFSTGFNIISKVFSFYWTFHIFIMYFKNGTMGQCPPPMWIWAHLFSDNVSLSLSMNVFTSLLVVSVFPTFITVKMSSTIFSGGIGIPLYLKSSSGFLYDI